MRAPNVNGRLHLTGVHQKPPASFKNVVKKYFFYAFPCCTRGPGSAAWANS